MNISLAPENAFAVLACALAAFTLTGVVGYQANRLSPRSYRAGVGLIVMLLLAMLALGCNLIQLG